MADFGTQWLEKQGHERRRQAAYDANRDPTWLEKLFQPAKPIGPPIRDQVAGGIDWLNKNYGPKEWNKFDNTSKGLAGDVTETLENTTPLGAVTGYEDAQKLAREGRGGLAALVGGASLAGLALPGGRTMKHPISALTLKQPLETMTREIAPGGAALEARKAIDWGRDLPIGSTILPLYGDRTAAGHMLTGVNGKQLTRPIEMQGGSDFGRRGQGTVWASEGSRIDPLEKRVMAAAEESGGKPVFGAYAAMGGESGDFSHMQSGAVLDLLMQARDAGELDPKMVALLDTKMGEQTKGNWPGVGDVGFDWLTRPGSNRTALSKTLDTKPFQKETTGFPDIGAVRNAVTEPELRDVPQLSSGRNIFQLDPGSRPASDHQTYNTGMGGSYVGSPEHDPGGLPWDVLFRDVYNQRKDMVYENGPRAGQPLDLSNHMRAFEMSPTVKQTVDQQLIDALSQRDEMIRQRGR